MTAWVLPDHIADVLPAQARQLEELRRVLLDSAARFGYELIAPPLIEHIDSLLTGTGEALDLQTFKLVDQLSGRTLGLRADTTPQAARIDAHLLNRQGVARLSYCGPVVHTRPDKPHATREPLQLGCELFGHEGLEADLEVQQLAVEMLQAAGMKGLTLDLADTGLVRAVLGGVVADAAHMREIHRALAYKDAASLRTLLKDAPSGVLQRALALTQLYGGVEILEEASKTLFIEEKGNELASSGVLLLSKLKQIADYWEDNAAVALRFDLADARGYGYYSGVRFGLYAQGASDALVRGGRYDEVGAVFGRNRAAVGFSLDLKELVEASPAPKQRSAIRAPWGLEPELQRAIRSLRARGDTVVCVLPGHEQEIDEFNCDRELRQQGGVWVVQTLETA
jgi:ATP phosphoribosyltransferase regulatory subunit